MKTAKGVQGLILGGLFVLACAAQAGPNEICLQDEFGEQIHLKILANGLVSGYSEFNEVITGTAFGSYKKLSEQEVMIGGDVNNDCNSGLFPGKFNARLNLKTMTGQANGFILICGEGTVVPFNSALYACNAQDDKQASWEKIFRNK